MNPCVAHRGQYGQPTIGIEPGRWKAPAVAAAVAFVGNHFLLSHPLRKGGASPSAKPDSERLFAGGGRDARLVDRGLPAGALMAPLWPVGSGLWALASVLMLIASVLLMGSLIRNPALPPAAGPAVPGDGARRVRGDAPPDDVVVRPVGLCHIAVFPVAKNIIVAAAIILLALVGSALQDRKKERLQPDLWPAWESKTSYLPFAAIAAGRARLGGFGLHALLGGLVVWLAASWAHLPLAGTAAGIWRWL